MKQPTKMIQAAAITAIRKAGGVSALARTCNVTRQAVQSWQRVGIPLARVPFIADLLMVRYQDLRPDIYRD